VILRLETVGEFGTIYAEIAPVMGIVKETRSKIAGIIPQVANELDEVNSLLGDLTVEAGEVSASELPTEASDEEAKKILDETGIIAEERLHEHFPELPSISERAASPLAEPANATNNNGYLQEQVYRYAKEHPSFNITSCADELGKSPNEIRSAIDKLRDDGKIAVE